MRRKKALERIESLVEPVELHIAKLLATPDNRDAPHWRTELRAWLSQIEDCLPSVGQRTGKHWRDKITAWKVLAGI